MLKNLKLKISVSIFGLVMTGMLMIALIAFVFMLHSNTRVEVARFQSLLSILQQSVESEQFSDEQYVIIKEREGFLGQGDIDCLSVLKDGMFLEAPIDCTDKHNIKGGLLKVVRSGKALVEFKGGLWERFFEKQSFIIASPIIHEGKSVGGLALSGNLQAGYYYIHTKIEITFVYILVNAIILTVIGFYRMVKLVIRPLEQLVKLSDSYDDNASTGTLFRSDANEFGQLAFRLRQLMKRIEQDNNALKHTVESLQRSNEELQQARSEVIRAEKLATVGRLSAGLAHEIGNPLGIVKGYLEMLEHDDISALECRQFATRAGDEVARMDAIISQLLDYSRQSKSELTHVNIDEILRDLVILLGCRKLSRKIDFIENYLISPVTVMADYDSLRQVFLNCLLNSIDAIEEKKDLTAGVISITISLERKDEGRRTVVIDISDNGVGVAPQQLEDVFDPFFTTKEPGKGTGLGLAVSYTLVEQFGGQMTLVNNESGGACARIELPYSYNDGESDDKI
jgi:signal transduction histidine kinase